MSGEPDPLYVRARRALLDAADALEAHLDAVVLVGAQAVYRHAGDADLLDAGAPYTTDADLAIRPSGLAESPLVGDPWSRHGQAAESAAGRREARPSSCYGAPSRRLLGADWTHFNHEPDPTEAL